MRWGAVTAAVAGGALALGIAAGCSSAAPSSDAASSPVVTDAYVGEAAAGSAAALYLTIHQTGGDDRLVGISTDVSDVVGIMRAAAAMDDPLTDRSVDLAVPAGATVVFQPGGDHVMLVDVSRDLVPGDNVAVTLVFERHGEVTVQAETSSLLDINERVAEQRDADGGSDG